MARTNWTIDVIGNDSEQPVEASSPYKTINNVLNYLSGTVSGSRLGNVQILARGNAAQATGNVVLSAASGAVGATINGVTVTATAAGGDSASAILVRDAINNSANPLVNQHVSAAIDPLQATRVILTSKQPGAAGNAVVIAASGAGVTASGARLTGGAETLSTFNF